MPRRYYDYLPEFHTGHLLSTIGAFVLFTGLVVMTYNLIYHIKRGAIAPSNPWKGVTLEWQIPSPPSHENFEEIPTIVRDPYYFGENKSKNS